MIKSLRCFTSVGIVLLLVACAGKSLPPDRTSYGDANAGSSAKNAAEALLVPPDLTVPQTAPDPLATSQAAPSATSSVATSSSTSSASSSPSAHPNGAPAVVLNKEPFLPMEDPSLPATLVRKGSMHYLETKLTPTQLWAKLESFWDVQGFKLTMDSFSLGLQQTEWKQSHPKVDAGAFRNFISKVFSNTYSTGLMDTFRTRLETEGSSTYIYIAHQGREEVYTGAKSDSTTWQRRPSDPELEIEMLSRLVLYLGGKSVPVDLPAKERATLVAEGLIIKEVPEWSWRQVGTALDRADFAVDERDVQNLTYLVRLVEQGEEEPDIVTRVTSKAKKPESGKKYKVIVSLQGEGQSRVNVLSADGQPLAAKDQTRVLKEIQKNL